MVWTYFFVKSLYSEFFFDPIAIDNPKSILSKVYQRKNTYCSFSLFILCMWSYIQYDQAHGSSHTPYAKADFLIFTDFPYNNFCGKYLNKGWSTCKI